MKQQCACGCGKRAASERAKYHEPACRVRAHRAKIKGNGTSWHDVSDSVKRMAQEFVTLAPHIYIRLNDTLSKYGAAKCEAETETAYLAFIAGIEAAQRELTAQEEK